MTTLVTTLIVTTPHRTARDEQREPITVGIPLPRGLVTDAGRLVLVDREDGALALQATATDHWSDGSLRWALLDFQLTGPPRARRELVLHLDEAATALTDALVVTRTARGIIVDTGAARFVMRPGQAFPFSDVIANGRAQIEAAQARLCVTWANGRQSAVHVESLEIESAGPLRTTIRLDGRTPPGRQPGLLFVARLHFFAGMAAVRVALTVRNPQRARHRGGFWELGDAGSVLLEDVSLHFQSPSDAIIECSSEIGYASEDYEDALELYQDSSGGENWQHPNHVNREGRIPCSFRGYRLAAGERSREGRRATPAVVLRAEHGSIGIAVEQFWQNFPQSLEADRRRLIYRPSPRQHADVHELQGGEQKTHRFTLMFGQISGRHDACFWGTTPSLAYATPAWYVHCRALPYLTLPTDAPSAYEDLITAAIEGPEAFKSKQERADEYGWRHFGDLYADHENAFSGRSESIVSHYNNQYDAVAGFATQFMRSADERWWALMNDLAHHVVDIDIYHTDDDKAAYNNGLFWHTAHYVDAGRSTHRSYPNAAKAGGGGLSNEHNYATGLMLHYFMTGDPGSREAAIGLARWVIAMDDGRQTIFRWLAPTSTGLASQTNSPDYHGPGRGAGHSLRALLDGHRLTREPAFLQKAEELIRRVIHPLDDVDAHRLLDAERRWSYTAFLQALGSYLDHKAERGGLDAMYDYARASLLRYARWMHAHEYPYLERPEILEYPTETWAAQDIRKSDVFYIAAMHAPPAERDAFHARGAFFFATAVQTLSSLATRTFTRPIVLLLTNGQLHAYVQTLPVDSAACAVTADVFPARPRFIPQKARARERLRRVGVTLVAAALLLPALVVFLR